MDATYEFDQSYATAAIALAHCGQEGFETLVLALDHDDPRIRLAAVVGLDVSGKEEANAYLDRAQEDVDERVRNRAAVRMGSYYFS